MDELFACPFCRQLFTRGEVTACPTCDLKVQRLATLPASHDANVLEELDVLPPEDERLPANYTGRSRGAVLLLAGLGLATFFGAPWLHESAPEIRTWTGFQFARHLAFIWGAGVAWMMLIPLALSRRTIRQMRGARVAVVFLAAMALVTVIARLLVTPTPHPLVQQRYVWGWGLHLTGFLAALTIYFGIKFGGDVVDMPSKQEHSADDTLH